MTLNTSTEGLRKRDYLKIFEDLVRELASGEAELSVITDPKIADLDLIVRVKPRKLSAAGIEAQIAFNSSTTLFFGQGAVFEVFVRKRHYEEHLQEVAALCKAVMQGRFEEVVSVVEGKIAGARGKVQMDDGPYAQVWRQLDFFPWRKKEKKLFKYSPYS